MILDKDLINSLMNDIDENSLYVQSLVDDLVNQCCGSLDKYIEYVKDILNDTDREVTNEELDDIIMAIPTILYSVGVCQEKLGIKSDVSSSSRQLQYNKIYIDTAGTAGIKKAVADNELFNESLITVVYDRAYDIIKSKINFAFEILQSAKKVMSRRISELELSRSATGRVSTKEN
jgi:hypothetical protein